MKNLMTCMVLAMLISTNLKAQELSVDSSSYVNIQDLPEYVVVTSENTKLIGGINISIDCKKSDYESILGELETLLQNRKKLSIRNQTDLLNAMSELGFEYINAYAGKAGTLGSNAGGDLEVFGSRAKYRTNMVFRKKKEFHG